MTSEQAVFVWAFRPGDTAPVLCGRLTVQGSPTGQRLARFVYGKTYIEDRDSVALDPIRLPKLARVFETTSVSEGEPDIFGVIADALPDSWGRYVISRRYGPQEFPVGYLLKASGDAVGNLCFSASPGEVPTVTAPVRREMLDVAWGVIAGLESGQPIEVELLERVRPNTAMGGARPKLTVADDKHQWLAKFPAGMDDRRYSQAKAEAAMLDLARQCGITAAEAELHTVRHPDSAEHAEVLLVKRFDRTLAADGRSWLRDAFVSARTIAQSEPAARGFQYMATYDQVAEQLQRWSVRPVEDRHELFRRLVFNCCISNTDDHDRNYGLLADEGGHLFRLSPAYDMVPRIQGTRIRRQAMSFGDHGSEATIENLVSAAPAFGLSQADARQILDSVQGVVLAQWEDCLSRRGMARREIQFLAPCFQPLPFDARDVATPKRDAGMHM